MRLNIQFENQICNPDLSPIIRKIKSQDSTSRLKIFFQSQFYDKISTFKFSGLVLGSDTSENTAEINTEMLRLQGFMRAVVLVTGEVPAMRLPGRFQQCVFVSSFYSRG